MDIQLFEKISLYLCLGALVLFMFFIIWDLAKKSKAGRFGTIMLFVVLGAGIAGFLVKEILVHTL